MTEPSEIQSISPQHSAMNVNNVKISDLLAFLDFKRNYLPDNLIMAVSVSLEIFSSTTRKSVEYFALGLTLKPSLGMNHTTGIRIS